MKPIARLFALAIVLVCGFALARAESPAEPAPYKVSTVHHVGGEGRWDYCIVDSVARRLYVPRQTHTQVLKLPECEVIGDLPNTVGVHGVALATALDLGFTSNGTANTVTVFQLSTIKVIGTVATGQKPDAIIFDPATNKVFCFNGKSDNVTIIDAAADPAVAKPVTLALPGGPEYAVSDGAGHVYVNIEEKSSVVEIDSRELKVVATWKIEGGEEPSGLAIDAAHHLLFAGCHNEVMAIIDTQSGKTIATAPIGKGVDACAFNPSTGEAFASCGDGTLTVVAETSPGKFQAVQKLETRKGARTMALDAASHTIYLPTAEFADAPTATDHRPAAKQGTFMIVAVSRGK